MAGFGTDFFSKNKDRRIGLILLGVIVLAVVGVGVLLPAASAPDPTPTSYNTSSDGAKAAYLLMSEIGLDAARLTSPPADLEQLDAPHTTLVLAEPEFPNSDAREIQAQIAGFIARGGRVLATGSNGAYLLPGGHTAQPTQVYKKLCLTTPEGQDALASAGKLSTTDSVRWDTTPDGPAGNKVTVAQRCGSDAVVVSYPYRKGEAIWWSSAMPLSNAGLKEDASLKLVLASLGPHIGEEPRHILFDEYFHGNQTTLWGNARGLPIAQLQWQAAFVAVLLVLSFGRRNGPLRMPVRLPRTSPIEFAESMGRLYQSAKATRSATDSARRRLVQFLGENCGVPREILRGSAPEAIVEAVQHRFGGDWTRIAAHLTQASEAEYNKLTARSALELVQALDRDQIDLAAATGARQIVKKS